MTYVYAYNSLTLRFLHGEQSFLKRCHKILHYNELGRSNSDFIL